MVHDVQTIDHVNTERCAHLAQVQSRPYVPFSKAEVWAYFRCPCQQRLPLPELLTQGMPGWYLESRLCVPARALRPPPGLALLRLQVLMLKNMNAGPTRGYAVVARGSKVVTVGVFVPTTTTTKKEKNRWKHNA